MRSCNDMMRGRIRLQMWILAAFFAYLAINLYTVQIRKHDIYYAEARKKYVHSKKTDGVRGEIFDILEGGYRAYNAKTGKFIAPRPWWDNFLAKVDSKIDKWVRSALKHQGLVVI